GQQSEHARAVQRVLDRVRTRADRAHREHEGTDRADVAHDVELLSLRCVQLFGRARLGGARRGFGALRPPVLVDGALLGGLRRRSGVIALGVAGRVAGHHSDEAYWVSQVPRVARILTRIQEIGNITVVETAGASSSVGSNEPTASGASWTSPYSVE